MAVERVRVGYVELTEEESKRLLKEVQSDQQAETLEDLQRIMENYDARMADSAEGLVEEVIEEAEGKPTITDEEIEVFPKVEGGRTYRIKTSSKGMIE